MIVSGRRKLAKMVTTVAVEEVLVLQWHCSCRCCRRQAHLMLLDASAMSGSCRWRRRRRMLMVERRGGRRLAAVGGKMVVAAAMAPRAARSGWLHGAPGQICFAPPDLLRSPRSVLRSPRSNCEGWLFFLTTLIKTNNYCPSLGQTPPKVH